jgi:membrane protein required for colicin V production
MMRGFTREVLSLLAWGTAAVAAFFAIRSETLVNLAKQYLEPEIVAKIAVAGGVFLIVLIVVSVISVKIADYVLDSAAGAFDRTLGFVYGLARGLVLVAIAYLFYGWLMPADRQEDWIKNARTLPYIKSAGELILSFVPPDIAETLTNTAILGNPEGQATRTEPSSAADQPEGSEGYKKTETNGLDQLIQGTQGAQQPAQGAKDQPAFGSESNPN